MKRKYVFYMILLFPLSLSGCKNANEPMKTDEQMITDADVISDIPQEDDRRTEAYLNAVQTIYEEHILPDGTQLDSVMEGYDNYYQIDDVDNDGHEELIINYLNADTNAGMLFVILDYDIETEEFLVELMEYPLVTIYNNGVITAGVSHSSGIDYPDGFWPYSVYQYQEDSDTYELVDFVDAISKEIEPDGEKNEEFPEDEDLDQDGFIYFLADLYSYEPAKYMEQADYEEWLNQWIGNATVIEYEWKKIESKITDTMKESKE